MPVPYAPLAVANAFLDKFGDQGGIEHMKLQKLVYCAYGWWLAVYGMDSPRLTTEGPQIWKHGPVFESLYHELKVFGREKITVPQSSNPFADPEIMGVSDDNESNFIEWVWGRYGHLSGFALSDLTHKPGTPWHRVATENNFSVAFNTAIPDQYIFEEFTRLLNAARIAATPSDERQNDERVAEA